MNATDKDTGLNAQLKFVIISGNDDGTFELNETSGELVTAKSLDYDEEPKSYKVRENRTVTSTNDLALLDLLGNFYILGRVVESPIMVTEDKREF